MPDQFSQDYYAGGLDYGDSGAPVGSFGGILGRFANNLTGATATNLFNSREAAIAREFNSAEAEKNRRWETEMSNTAYQRQVADMKAAGLNPASVSGGGAEVPQGYAASANSASGVNPGSGSGGLIGSVARAVLSAVLFKKFSASAARAATAQGAVNAVGSASAKAEAMQKALEDEHRRIQRRENARIRRMIANQ